MHSESDRERGLTRRRLLELGAQGAVALGGAALLDACGSASSNSSGTGIAATSAAAPGGTPVRGGTFTVGLMTGGSSETVNPALASYFPDICRVYALYDGLYEPGPNLKMVPMLAVAAEPNKDATLWTIKLRDGVVWHDGKPFTADDVVYTFHQWASPTNLGGAVTTGVIDYDGVRKLGRLEVEVPLHSGVADLPSLLGLVNQMIVQDGSTTAQLNTKPNGTGPFKFESFTVGSRSVFSANREYWDHPKPYVDTLVIDSSFTDETTRLNSLLSSVINVLPGMPPVEAKNQVGSGQIRVLRSHSGGGNYLCMRVDAAPFNDPRVRTALKLAADREALIEGALEGFGRVGNDLLGKDCQYYDGSVQHPHDPEKAKALLKAAGHENFTFKLPTSPVGPGFVEAATLYAEQAQAAGMNVIVEQLPTSVYFAYANGYLKRPIQQSSQFASPTLTAVYRGYATLHAPYNETTWGTQPGAASWNKLLAAAIAEQDATKAQDLWTEVQTTVFNDGGYVCWTYADNLDAVANDVRGLRTSNPIFLNDYRLQDGWLARS
jgi:peptide/nickel transport system substrate-binding protein